MVNWDPAAKTALSDEEVVFKESHGKLYYLRYKVEGTDKAIIVATTRPETILGDTALCVNPNDPRYASLPADARVIVPLVNRSIPVIRDEYVDIEFGTGALKVTPAHDVNDYMLGEKYGLETIDIFNDDGTINDKVGMYVGMDRFDVRKQIEKDLAAAGLLEKTEEYTNNVGYSERTGVAIEPKLSMQWFLSMEELARPATKAVMEDAIRFVPEKYKNTYRHWMENIKDWCISRQLWWGQRIPAYYLPKGGYVVAPTAEEALAKARAKTGDDSLQPSDLRQDEDVLDTWFSSWLWPISVFDGIRNPDNQEISYYYPTNDLVTGPDIIFFWVARMIMAGLRIPRRKAFRQRILHGHRPRQDRPQDVQAAGQLARSAGPDRQIRRRRHAHGDADFVVGRQRRDVRRSALRAGPQLRQQDMERLQAGERLVGGRQGRAGATTTGWRSNGSARRWAAHCARSTRTSGRTAFRRRS